MSAKVFLVEDNQRIRENLIEALQDLVKVDVVGHASDPENAVVWLASNDQHWDVAVVDLFLGRGSGLTVLAALRVRRARQKVIVLSNFATPEIRERCLAMGADRVFDKSTEIDEFLTYCSALEH